MQKKVRFIAILFLAIASIFSIFKVGQVLAGEKIVKLTDATVVDKSSTTQSVIENFSDDLINTKTTFYNLNDYVVYKLTIKNASSNDYILKSVSDNNANSNLVYEYTYDENSNFASNTTKEVTLKITYKNEVTDMTKRDQDNDIKITITLDSEDGSTEENIIINPKTHDGIMFYIITFIVSSLALVILTVRKKKTKVLLITFMALMPLIVKATFVGVVIKLNTDVALKDKVVVTYNVNGNNVTEVIPYNSKPNKPNDPVVPGYQFDGWYKGNTLFDFDNSTLSEDEVITAKLTPVNYTITCNLDGGNGTSIYNYNVESAAFTLDKPSKDAFNFIGWTGEGITEPVYELTISTGTYGDKNYTANYAPRDDTPYHVTHKYENLDGTFTTNTVTLYGVTNSPQTIDPVCQHGFSCPTPEVLIIDANGQSALTYTYNRLSFDLTTNSDVETTFTNPSYLYETSITVTAKNKDGYTFNSWSDNSTDNPHTFTLNDNTEMIPSYTANNYTVIFNANNGSDETSNQTFTYDQIANLNNNPFSYAGYTFSKWNTQADGQGSSNYNNGASVSNLATSGTVNLYAIWTPNPDTLYVVTHRYENLDGSYDVVSVDAHGTTDTYVTAETLPRVGHDTPTEEQVFINGNGTGSHTYTYPLSAYTFTVNEDVTTTFTEPSYKYGTSITVTANNKEGYTFSSWSDNSTDNPHTFIITKNTNMYPNYTANKYNVVFNSNTTDALTHTQEITYDQTVNLDSNTFSNQGHVFAGWNTQADGNGTPYVDGASVTNLATSGNFDLYAIWNIETYTISFDSIGGSSVSDITREYLEELGELEKPRKDGFRFVGWYTQADGGEEVNASTKATATTTYYAHWEVQEVLCKKSMNLHTQNCDAASGKGCKLMGYTATGAMGTTTITYGSVAYNYTPGSAYNCDVNGDGIYSDETERFYYLRSTTSDKAVLIYSANFDNEGNVNNSVIYPYDEARTILPTSSLWSNVPEISDGVITRFASDQDFEEACPECHQGTSYTLTGCIYVLENTKFATSNDQYGRSAIWMEPRVNGNTTTQRRYRGDNINIINVTGESSNGVRPVIEIPLQYMDPTRTVIFDSNGGNEAKVLRLVNVGDSLTTTPSATKANALFDGWYTDATGGTLVDENTVPEGDVTYYAHYSNTIYAAVIPNETIILHPTETEQIIVNNVDEAYNYAIVDGSIASVSNTGLVEALAVGETTVLITGERSGSVRVVTVTVTADTSNFIVEFNSNGGDIYNPRSVPAGHAVGDLPTPQKSNYLFDAWYSDPELTNIVDKYTIVNEHLTLYAKWYSENDVAKIGHNYYANMMLAVEGALEIGNGSEIVVLKDFSDDNLATVEAGQIVNVNMNGHTYTFTGTGALNVFAVSGTLNLYGDGTITNGSTSGLIDVQDTGVLNITGGTYRATNTKQVVYNNGGIVTIDGDAILTSSAKDRAAVHNLNNGTMYIKSGQIISTGSNQNNNADNASHAIRNQSGILYIGVEGGIPSTTSPMIQGNACGIRVNDTRIYFYDGIVKGIKKSFSTAPDNDHIEPGTEIQFVNDGTYYTAYLDVTGYVITLNYNDGESPSGILTIDPGDSLTNLPTPTRNHYQFDGWYTLESGGDLVTTSTVPDGSHEYFAHWTYVPNDDVVTFRTTNDAMKTYYAKIDSWKDSSSNFPTWSDDNNKNNNWALDATENTVMMQNFNTNNCKCADNQCSSSGTVECDKPKGFDTGFNGSLTVRLSDESTKTKTGAIVSYAKATNGVIYNLIPGEVYYWELDSDPSIYGYVKFTGERRILNAGDVRNARDLGGLPVDTNNDGVVDGHLAYGRLFRGIKLDSSNSVTELSNLGVNSQLDLRESNSDANRLSRYNRIEAQNYYINYGTTNPNEATYYQMTRNAVTYAMQEIVDGKNLYFHCRIGTDRTGTVAYILEGLLNVPEEDRIEDYELSFFYGLVRIHRYHNEKPGSSVGTGKERFVYMHNFMPTNQDIYDWYMAGSTNTSADQALINQFRAAMIN